MAANSASFDKKRKASGAVKGKSFEKVKKARTETPKAAKPVPVQHHDDSDEDMSSDSEDGGVKVDTASAKSKKPFDKNSGKAFEKGWLYH
jgi:hypothetical protein